VKGNWRCFSNYRSRTPATSSDVIDPDMAGYLLVAACYLDYSCGTFRL